MTVAEIPTLADGEQLHYQQRTRLGEEDFLLTFLYSERRSVWTLSIAALDGSNVLTGQTIVCGIPLLGRAVGGPPGVLIALSESEDLTPPAKLELGGRVKLYYADSLADFV